MSVTTTTLNLDSRDDLHTILDCIVARRHHLRGLIKALEETHGSQSDSLIAHFTGELERLLPIQDRVTEVLTKF